MFDTATDTRPHAVVIGAGFGGLAAAIRLGARGWRVTVVEKRDMAGGRAYVYRQDGFAFDGGPTIITVPYLLEELWALAGRRMQDDIDLRRLEPFYDIRFDDGEVMACGGDIEATRREIRRIAPSDLPGFERFLKDSAAIYQVAFHELADQPFHSLGKLLRSAPDLIRLQGYRAVYNKVSDYFKSEKLRIAFSFHPLLIGGNPMTTTAYYCLIAHLERLHGVHYAMGGTGALVQGLVGLIGHFGGALRYGSEVAEILVANDRAAGVRLASGESIAADIVVSNADPGWTYGKLLAGRRKRRWTDRRIARARYSMSLFVWYFGTRRQYPNVPHHSILLGPRYGGLLDDIFTRKRLTDDFSIYLHRPTATDPSMAPPGCDAFYALTPVPNLRSGTDWATEAEVRRAALQRRLEEIALPGLGESLATSRVLTPQDFRDTLLTPHGAAFSLEPQLFQSAWFRPHNRSEELAGLYLVGAGTHPGAGVPGVLSSARVLDQIVPDAAALRGR